MSALAILIVALQAAAAQEAAPADPQVPTPVSEPAPPAETVPVAAEGQPAPAPEPVAPVDAQPAAPAPEAVATQPAPTVIEAQPTDVAPVDVQPAGAAAATASPGHPTTSLQAGVDVRSVETPNRPYRIKAAVEHFRPLVADQDVQNDLATSARLMGSYQVIDKGWAELEVGTDLRHSFDPGESAFDFRDVVVRFQYTHSVPWMFDKVIAALPKREFDLRHTASVYLPTSRLSRAQDKNFSLRATTEGSVNVIGGLYAGADVLMQYNSHRYDRGAGPGGRPYTAFIVQLGPTAEYVLDLPLGSLSLGTWFGQEWDVKYADTPVRPVFGYSVYASYTPFYYLTATLSLEHEVARRRGDGVVQNDVDLLFDRDATQVALRLLGRF